MARNYSARQTAKACELQNHMCAYCDLPFGTVVYKPGRGDIVQTAVGDHGVPYSYTARTLETNLFAACHICNALKGSNMFGDLITASRYIMGRRVEKRIVVIAIPEVALSDDPESWAKWYSRWLTRPVDDE